MCGRYLGSSPDALNFHVQLVKRLKLIFTQTKTHTTEQRLLLEQARIVLRFSEERVADDGSSESIADHFVHVGYANFQTWFFSVMRLAKVTDCNQNGHLQLTPLCCLERGTLDHGIRTIVQFAAETLDLGNHIRVKVFQMVENHHLLSEEFMLGSCVEVAAYAWIGDFLAWSGTSLEAMKRRHDKEDKPKRSTNPESRRKGAAAAQGHKRRATHPLQCPVSKKSVVSTESGLGVLDDEHDDELLSSVLATNNSSSDTDMLGGGGGSDDDGDSVQEHAETMIESDVVCSSSEQDIPSDQDSETNQMLAEALAPETDPEDDSDDDSSSSSGDSSYSSSSSSTSGRDEIVAGARKTKSPKSPTQRRAPLTEHVIHVGDGHELHFNISGEYMRAHCGQHEGCRRQRTVKPSQFAFHNRGQGRPIGLLMSWLQDAKLYETKAAHGKARANNFKTRAGARSFFKTCPNADTFLEFERGQEEGEGSEPEDII